jgi:hypothetical protein
MLISNKYEIPDKCPKNCPHKKEPFYQGNMCTRCPIFNCSKDKNNFCLIEPENYREDWAKEWYTFFTTGKRPVLLLRKQP